MTLQVWLIGEDNPYGDDPFFALYPLPTNASGGRLARILGLTNNEYMALFERRNLCAKKWSMKEARKTAAAIYHESKGAPIVLLGKKVATAFDVGDEPLFEVAKPWARGALTFFVSQHRPRILLLPHPSGRNRVWNESGARDRARIGLSRLRLPDPDLDP